MNLHIEGKSALVTASSLILTFVKEGDSASPHIRFVLLVGGFVALWAFASSKWVDRRLSRIIERLLKRYTDLNVTDYASLLHLTGEYRLAELKLTRNDWLDGKTPGESRLREGSIHSPSARNTSSTLLRFHCSAAYDSVVRVKTE